MSRSSYFILLGQLTKKLVAKKIEGEGLQIKFDSSLPVDLQQTTLYSVPLKRMKRASLEFCHPVEEGHQYHTDETGEKIIG